MDTFTITSTIGFITEETTMNFSYLTRKYDSLRTIISKVGPTPKPAAPMPLCIETQLDLMITVTKFTERHPYTVIRSAS